MHRSGTSLLTMFLNRMGGYLGPEKMLMGPSYDNPKGFWERLDVVKLNERLLNSAGCKWDAILNFKINAIPDGEKANFKKTASSIIKELDTHMVWVIKDPRMCLLLPLWLDLLTDPIIILMSRAPIEIALSLNKRNNFNLNFGIALWEYYILEALKVSINTLKINIDFNNLITNPTLSIERLNNELSLMGVKGLNTLNSEEIMDIIDPGLHHEKTMGTTHRAHMNLNQETLYHSLIDGSCFNIKKIPHLSQGALENLKMDSDIKRLEAHTKKLELKNIEYEKLLDDMVVSSNRLFDSMQYKFGSYIGALYRRVLRRPYHRSYPELKLRSLAKKFQSCRDKQ